MKRFATLAVLFLTALPAAAEEGCYDKVEVGDPVRQVVERCGEPKWRERQVRSPGKSVEIIRGVDSLRTHPVQPQLMEKWYYDTSPDSSTLIEIQDGGVLSKQRLERKTDSPANME